MQADYLRCGKGKQPERIIIPQVILGGERKFLKIINVFNIIGAQSCLCIFSR
jgi:hypothetical protein